MTEFDILLFSPGLPPSGERARARFLDGALVINDKRVDVALDAIGVTLGGFNHDQVYLFWHEEQGRSAITPVDPDALRQLLATAPAPLSDLLKGATRDINRQSRRSRLGLGMLGLVLALPLLLLGLLFWQSHHLAGWVASHISLENEQKLGDLAFKQATAGLTLRQTGLDAAAVTEIGTRLTKSSKYTYQWHIAEDPAINAFAVPGGHVVVNSGLIQAADSAEEVAGVLAHEVQHVELRHTLKNLVHSLGLRVALSLALGDISGGALGDVAATLSELRFSRDLESEADQKGLYALKNAGIAPQGMLTFFARLSQQEAGLAPPALLSTHPASTERMQAMRGLISQHGSWPSEPLPYDWQTIKAMSR